MTAVEHLSAALADRYRLERELGQGGMATVYLAEDLRHDRKVAIKVLKPELAAVLGAERFVQEIKTTAALSHPHILPLFDSGEAGGFLYYVMPFIEGETIREKLNRETQFGIEEAVRITTEVADALDYAHRHGVIHRDIKPENILLHDGRAIVMDFGIALAVSAAAGGRMTETGLSLGTPHYMSPEQATADKQITARSDVYSLASVLYEMLTGEPPHMGNSAQQIIMKIIAEPAQPPTELRKSIPPNVAAALGKALEKLPADRFESAKAFAAALDDPDYVVRTGSASHAPADATMMWKRVAAGLGAAVVILAGALVAVASRNRAGTATGGDFGRFVLSVADSLQIGTNSTTPFAFTPDGSALVYSAGRPGGVSRLWVRRLDTPGARELAGTDGGINAAVSPDGEWVAFLDGLDVLKKVRLDGGPVSTVAKLPGWAAAMSWASNDEIIVEQIGPRDGLHRVNVIDGKTERIVAFDSAAGELSQRMPLVLREQRMVLYTTSDGQSGSLGMLSLEDGRRRNLGIAGVRALGVIDGLLVYAGQGGSLFAVPLDVDDMRVTAEPLPLRQKVMLQTTGIAVAMSETGTLAYVDAQAIETSRIDLVDTSGTVRTLRAGLGPQTGNGLSLRYSPDGRHIALILTAERYRGDLWVIDARTGEPTQLTRGVAAAAPEWMPDSRRVLYLEFPPDRSGGNVEVVPIDGSRPASRYVDTDSALWAIPLGDTAVIAGMAHGGPGAIPVRFRLDGTGKADTLVPEAIAAYRMSPDGRWFAFQLGSRDVWLRSLVDDTRMQLSVGEVSGFVPLVWSPASDRVYYENGSGMASIALQTRPSLSVRTRTTIRSLPPNYRYDLAPDGKTFAVAVPGTEAGSVVVALNWATELRREWQARKRQ